jgi:hypothetical protein
VVHDNLDVMHGAYLVIGERATGRLSASTRKCCTIQ